MAERLFGIQDDEGRCLFDQDRDMIPATFPQANAKFRAPKGMDETQVATIPAFVGKWDGGKLDGANIVIVAWAPSKEELEDLNNGVPIYLCVLGGLPPHSLTTRPQFL